MLIGSGLEPVGLAQPDDEGRHSELNAPHTDSGEAGATAPLRPRSGRRASFLLSLLRDGW
ncbi:hypothetical protein [Capsulimonas corticalis]|uniref:hypothetical protein n=1 Tax=Capsulimonas corticalis TaxID=2219043 RepID=UPI000F646636|nr:hypothetical protein [Capsulimonas corticalis]